MNKFKCFIGLTGNLVSMYFVQVISVLITTSFLLDLIPNLNEVAAVLVLDSIILPAIIVYLIKICYLSNSDLLQKKVILCFQDMKNISIKDLLFIGSLSISMYIYFLMIIEKFSLEKYFDHGILSRLQGISALGLIFAFLNIALLGPIFEEFLFRKYYMDKLSIAGVPVVLVIILQAFLFGLMHSGALKISAFFLGILSGLIYLKYKNIFTSIFFHMIYNAVNFIVYFGMWKFDSKFFNSKTLLFTATLVLLLSTANILKRRRLPKGQLD